MRVGTGIGGWPGEAAGAAKRVEEAGYDYVTCGELSHDSMVLMAVAATGTELQFVVRDKSEPCIVTELPFYKRKR